MQEFELPRAVKFVLERLNRRGYEAYVVGGCVRDRLMRRAPSDYDVTTNARPEEMKEVFSDCRVVETGLKHGTLTLVFDEMSIEATTYRVDGAYEDGRRPSAVSFTASLEEDLSRRDFTVNAVAYSPRDGFVDPFHGMEDIARRRLVCVGDPVKRFSEDALRILRALRFSSTLDFPLDGGTAAAINDMYQNLSLISRERIFQETTRLICGPAANRVLTRFSTVVAFALDPSGEYVAPEDIFDVAQYADCAPCYPEMRYAVIFSYVSRNFRLENGELVRRDSAIPYCENENADCSVVLAKRLYASLKPSGKSMKQVVRLLENRFVDTSDSYALKRLMGACGNDFPESLIGFRMATRLISCRQCRREMELYEKLRDSAPCVTIGALSVTGADAAAAGLRGAAIGRALSALLDAVMREELPNERETLLQELGGERLRLKIQEDGENAEHG